MFGEIVIHNKFLEFILSLLYFNPIQLLSTRFNFNSKTTPALNCIIINHAMAKSLHRFLLVYGLLVYSYLIYL